MIAQFLVTAIVAFIAPFILLPIVLRVPRRLGLYTIVEEGTAHVYVLFGKVVGVIDEAGFHLLPLRIGPAALLISMLGSCRVIDMRLDQEYLRSQPVNSEEGAPVGVGIWYEMQVSNPVDYLFQNADPRGSLMANVSNATVRCLSNMPLEELLASRHRMSRTVRAEVTEKSTAWGYRVGSVYIRKVHFRDAGMIRQIEAKVVNRLRQVTSAIRQNGANEVGIISNTAERTAAIEFAKAAAIRLQVVGGALNEIARDPEIEQAVFGLLEIQKLQEHGIPMTRVPRQSGMLADMIAAGPPPPAAPAT
jgi:regulator of protease activity HflC (stomatin/prohibitin superfamily)